MRVASIALRTRRRKPASQQAMTVIALASSKGGVGKTTLTMNLAAGLSRRGRTVLVDADPQLSAGQWRRVFDGKDLGFSVASADGETTGAIVDSVRVHRNVVGD